MSRQASGNFFTSPQLLRPTTARLVFVVTRELQGSATRTPHPTASYMDRAIAASGNTGMTVCGALLPIPLVGRTPKPSRKKSRPMPRSRGASTRRDESPQMKKVPMLGNFSHRSAIVTSAVPDPSIATFSLLLHIATANRPNRHPCDGDATQAEWAPRTMLSRLRGLIF